MEGRHYCLSHMLFYTHGLEFLEKAIAFIGGKSYMSGYMQHEE